MLKLAMAPLHPNLFPTLLFEVLNNCFNFHLAFLSRPRLFEYQGLQWFLVVKNPSNYQGLRA